MNLSETSYLHATFAGGCFWCMVSPFESFEGVIQVTSGYTGGDKREPSYEEVCSGTTGHHEAVDIIYDPTKITYSKLLEIFWRQINPTDPSGQFADRGPQYETAVFYHNEEQRKLAEASKMQLQKSGLFKAPIQTKILPAQAFYPAEEYHQGYHHKNPDHYQRYREGSGREAYLKQTWESAAMKNTLHEQNTSFSETANTDLKKSLTPMQYRVTQENGTEPPFQNEYWNNHQEGLYVDIISGEPLFSSSDKFDSGCGWPSFTKPIVQESIMKKEDRSHGMVRAEIRSQSSDSHLGHVFDDGPPETGLRYCINSAALKFIPVEDLMKEGYGEYLGLFNTNLHSDARAR